MGGLLCPRRQSRQNAAGAAFGEHLRVAGAHRRLAPDPIYGSVSLWVYVCSRRAKSRPVSVLLSAHWGLLPSKFDGIATLTYTASCVPTCLVRRTARARTRTSCHSFSARGGAISTVFLSKFKYVGPSGPGQVVSQILSSGRREVSIKSPGGCPP